MIVFTCGSFISFHVDGLWTTELNLIVKDELDVGQYSVRVVRPTINKVHC